YPSSYADTLGRWLLHPAHIRSPIAWAASVTNWFSVTEWIDLYWDFLSPAHLFANPQAPAWVGVFLAPVYLLIPFRVLGSMSSVGMQRIEWRIILVRAAVLPLVPAAFKEQRAIERAASIIPIGAVFAARGVHALWTRATVLSRACVIALVVTAGVQFTFFYRHV